MLNDVKNVVLTEQIKNNLAAVEDKTKLLNSKIENLTKLDNRAANMLPRSETELKKLKSENKMRVDLLKKKFGFGFGVSK